MPSFVLLNQNTTDVTAVLQPLWRSIGCLVRVQLSNSVGTLGLES